MNVEEVIKGLEEGIPHIRKEISEYINNALLFIQQQQARIEELEKDRAYKDMLATPKEFTVSENKRLRAQNQQLKDRLGALPSEEEISSLSAQAYCSKENEHKVVDPILLFEIARIISNRINKEVE